METAEQKDNQPRTVPAPSNSQVIKEQAAIMAMLQEQHQTKAGPRNLYAHISEVLSHLVMFYPDQALQRLEEVSYILKNQDTIALEEFLRVHDDRSHSRHSKQVAGATSKQIDTMRDWFKKGEGEADAMAIEEPVEGEVETAAIGFIPDIISENKHLYPWAGISLGEYGCLILQKSLKELCTKTGATNMRFWGKIRGTHADYFIAEGTSDAAPAEGGEDNEGGARGDVEARGEGVNVYSYWVTNCPENKSWVLLPDLKPEDLDAARGSRVQFTGNLNKKIYTNPFFFKAEQYLLRAQIARISFSTSLVPVGAYRSVADEPTQVEDNIPEDAEDPKAPIPSTSQANGRHMWAHYTRNILKCGRITHTEPTAPENDEGGDFDIDAAKLAQEGADPFERRLKSISEDASVVGGLPAWVVREYGDSSSYASANPAHPNQQFNVVVVKSLLWPGAHTFFSRGAWTQVYVGDGLKHEACTYFPVNPPIMCADPVERKCEMEPNPTEEYLQKKAAAEKQAQRQENNDDE